MLYAHFNRETNKGQLLNEHLEQTVNNMLLDTQALDFGHIAVTDLIKCLRLTGACHDIGKAMPAFQKYLATGEGGAEKNHALISATVLSFVCPGDFLYYLAFLAVAKHHGRIDRDIGIIKEVSLKYPLVAKQYNELSTVLKTAKLPDLFNPNLPKFTWEDLEVFLQKFLRYKFDKKHNNSMYFFFLQYLFSKLIWADKFDTAGKQVVAPTQLPCLRTVAGYIVEKQGGFIANLEDTRCIIRKNILQMVADLTEAQLRKNRIFTITAPTGTGKTIASISAAIALADKLGDLYGYRPRLITAMPFINILEQTRADYEAIFKKVLVHHSSMDYSSVDDQETPLQDKMLTVNAWEENVIITTFVQLFESILSNHNKALLKVNKLAGSIVILDEIQSLPIKYYNLIGAILEKISRHYGTRFILMTATQPKIVESANQLLDNIDIKEELIESIELLPDNLKFFENLQRTQIIPRFPKDKMSIDDLAALVVEKIVGYKSALVVVNTIKNSIDLFKKLKSILDAKILYLSTNLTPSDRRKVIEEAKVLIQRGEHFIMVSTQTIEAGVDLDFDIGFRDLAPLPSIIQIAGRINRNGNKQNNSPLYIVETYSKNSKANSAYIYNKVDLNRTKALLREVVPESEYSRIMDKYYSSCLQDGVPQESLEIFKAIRELDYETITKFELIKTQDLATVIIESPANRAIIVNYIEEYCTIRKKGRLNGGLDFEEQIRLKLILNRLSEHSVDVRVNKLRQNIPCKFKDVWGTELEMYYVPCEDISRYYDETGFITDNPEAFIY